MVDPRELSFSQMHGYEPKPEPLALGELSDEARRRLWDLVWLSARVTQGDLILWRPGWSKIMLTLHRKFSERTIDTFVPHTNVLNGYKTVVILEPLNRVFDLFQLIMRDPNCPDGFAKDVARIFTECRLAYVVDLGDYPTVLPAATEQEGQALRQAIEDMRSGGLHGAEAHLLTAGELINQGDAAGSVRESIHAVEAVARQLTKGASPSLSTALTALKMNEALHPALRDAFNKLYGYTSDEQGIRHALIDEPTADVGMDEALFMLGACASFTSYLWRKHVHAT